MKTFQTDIAHAPELHRLYLEFLEDTGQKNVPTPDMWFHKYQDPTFFCLFMKHGKKPVGITIGKILPYYEEPRAELHAFFVRRGFRSLKFIRGLLVATKKHLGDNNVKGIVCFTPNKRARRNKTSLVLVERGA